MASGLFDRLGGAITRRLPPGLRRPVRRLALLPVDACDRLLGRRPPLVPPRGLQYHGAGDYEATGRHLFDLLVEQGGLEATARVLDIGCGIGRVAVQLARFLSPEASYDGFDIARSDIRWCRRHLTGAHPAFRFHFADIRNSEYNPRGSLCAAQYRFPCDDGQIDFAFATSVFTHLLEPEATHYLAEAARVLRPGGTLCATFFLLNDEVRELTVERNLDLRFPSRLGEAHVYDARTPEAIVAFDEAWIRESCARAGLGVSEPIRYGSWCGRAETPSYQDLLVATRSRTP